MRTPSKIIVAVAHAGMAVAGGAAFTGGGLAIGGDGQAPASQFIGGSVNQTVTGAEVVAVDYTYVQTDLSLTKVTKIVVTFDDNTPADSVANIVVTGDEVGAPVWTKNATLTSHAATFNVSGSGASVSNITNLKITVDTPEHGTQA